MSIFCRMSINCKAINTAMLIGVTVLNLNGCETTKTVNQNTISNRADPYEGFNRKVYQFNENVDNYVAEPVAHAYQAITPQFLQTGIFNFYNNLKNVNIVINDLLQAKFKQVAQDTGRFTVNTTLGLLGVVDAAKKLGLEQNNEDFEQTLAVWGVPRGPYLVVPFLGPVTARGLPGAAFDTAANPSTYFFGAPIQVVSVLNTRANAEGSIKFINEAALDPYVFTRESFLQWRKSLATDGHSEDEMNFDENFEDNQTDDSGKSSFTNEAKQFSHVSQVFLHISESFNQTSKSFENAINKLDLLKEEHTPSKPE